MRQRTFSRGALLLVLVAVALTGAIAMAFWSGGGSGSGQTRLQDPLAVALTPGTLDPDQLFPGTPPTSSSAPTTPTRTRCTSTR